MFCAAVGMGRRQTGSKRRKTRKQVFIIPNSCGQGRGLPSALARILLATPRYGKLNRASSTALDLLGAFGENGRMSNPEDCNLWSSAEHALEYLRHADSIPHRTEREAALLEFLPPGVARILDVGSGDGRLVALAKSDRPQAALVAMDFSSAMLEALHRRFAADGKVTVVAHDFSNPLPALGLFDAVISSFAIHHVAHGRKRSLYQEIFRLLQPGGVFCNLEHVASPTDGLHHQFLDRLGIAKEQEDPSNKLLDLEAQLGWLREIGFVDVDCHWKWRELALLAGVKPASPAGD